MNTNGHCSLGKFFWEKILSFGFCPNEGFLLVSWICLLRIQYRSLIHFIHGFVHVCMALKDVSVRVTVWEKRLLKSVIVKTITLREGSPNSTWHFVQHLKYLQYALSLIGQKVNVSQSLVGQDFHHFSARLSVVLVALTTSKQWQVTLDQFRSWGNLFVLYDSRKSLFINRINRSTKVITRRCKNATYLLAVDLFWTMIFFGFLSCIALLY